MENNLIYTVAWNNYLTECFLITLQFRVPLYNPHIMPTTWYVSHTIIILNNVENVFLKSFNKEQKLFTFEFVSLLGP